MNQQQLINRVVSAAIWQLARRAPTWLLIAIVGGAFLVAYAHGETITVETHNGITYGRSAAGQQWQTETHNGVTYGRSNDGKRWTEETHNGVTYVHPQN
jgi:hypothetical protein